MLAKQSKEQKGRCLAMLLGTLGASLLGNLLTGEGAIAPSQGRKANMSWTSPIRAAERIITADQILKYKSIIKMNLNLMVFIQETIYLK